MARGLRMASAGARAYNGGLGAEPPAGSRGRAPGQGVRGRSLLSFQGTMKVAKFTPLTNWQTDFCHVSTTLNRVPNTSLLRSEEWRLQDQSSGGTGRVLSQRAHFEQNQSNRSQLWPSMSLHWKDAHCALLVWHVSHVYKENSVPFFLWQLTKLNENFNCSDFSKLKWWCLIS